MDPDARMMCSSCSRVTVAVLLDDVPSFTIRKNAAEWVVLAQSGCIGTRVQKNLPDVIPGVAQDFRPLVGVIPFAFFQDSLPSTADLSCFPKPLSFRIGIYVFDNMPGQNERTFINVLV